MFPFPSPLLTVAAAAAGGGGTGVVAQTSVQDFTGASGAVNMPTNSSGDLVIVQIFNVGAGTAATTTPPAGWTLLNSVAGNSNVTNQMVYGRVMDGSEGSTVTFTWNGSTTNRQTNCQAFTIRGQHSGTYVEGATSNSGSNNTVGTNNIACAAVTTTGVNRIVFNFFGMTRGTDNTMTGSADSWTDIWSNSSRTASGLHTDTSASYQVVAAASTPTAETRHKDYASGGAILWDTISLAIIMA